MSIPMRGGADLANNAAMGAIAWLRTGNLIIDMIIACCIPLVFNSLFNGAGRQAFDRAWTCMLAILNRTKGGNRECIRSISFVNSSRHGPQAFDQRNELLQKALALYLTEVVNVRYKKKAQVALTALHDARWGMERPDRHNPLASYRLTWLAPENEWVELDHNEGIDFRQQTIEKNAPDGSTNSTSKEQVVYELKCTGARASEKIDALISKAVEWYKAELRRQRDDRRYLYVMHVQERFGFSSTDKAEDDAQKYKRYRLSDHKTFDSLFFPEKDSLLALLDDFEKKRGKFGVAGFPHKLGLMLHGPPGTGKTSLIKALAHATERSIISIPLSQIKTNQQLMDVMYDLKLQVHGQDSSPTLEFKDVIFVIEDVDAASKIVLRREGQGSEPTFGPEQVRELAAAAARAQAGPPQPKPEGEAGDEEGPKASARPATMDDMLEAFIKPRPDELNLAGLLNVLDGVVDTPGRLLILTSNHPEKLDPALIRPGRVDRLIHLGYMRPDEASKMLTHYFGVALDARQAARLATLLAKTGGVGGAPPCTPAMLEQLCACHATIDALLNGLAEKVGAPVVDDCQEEAPRNGSPMNTGTTEDIYDGKGEAKLMPIKRQPSGVTGGG